MRYELPPPTQEPMADDKLRALQRNLAAAKERRRECWESGDTVGANDAGVIIEWAARRIQAGMESRGTR